MGIRRTGLTAALVALTAFAIATPAGAAIRFSAVPKGQTTPSSVVFKKAITPAERLAAAKRVATANAKSLSMLLDGGAGVGAPFAVLDPLGQPDYMGGVIPNYANSQLPSLDLNGNVVPGTGIRKFVDSLPGLGYANRNNLGQYIPVAAPDTTTYPGCDYYEIELVQYTEKLGSDIPTTTLRGYRQTNTTDPNVSKPNYLGPIIVAQRDRPVRVKFTNSLPTGTGGNLFLPVDTSVMGAGMGPNGTTMYTQNRATLHLHGGATPWISDGTPDQWTTPAGENTSYPAGVSVYNVPDMPDPGPGSLTFFYTNQQSARLMFYHDHAFGITRLNVYAGEAAGYLLSDPVEQKLVNGGIIGTVTVAPGTVPAEQIPLVIQDKTFVPDLTQLANEDPTWDVANWGGTGNLWFPHVYMPNQNPKDLSGANAMGRWDYGPWFWPPLTPGTLTHGVLPNGDPGTPNPSLVPEAFMDTPLVNGTAYPYVKVGRKAYRLRILNACNDRSLNLQLYFASSNTPDAVDPNTGAPTLQTASGEVTMVPAVPHPATVTTWPATWPTDGRDGGVPDPTTAGPQFLQVGTEGGLLPGLVKINSTPIGYNYNRRDIVVLNISNHSLLLGPAERADVIVDFSGVPDGSKLILYNDAPAPVPAFDPRYDYYTGDPDQTSTGGAPSTKAGYGPNTRTIMQFQVSGAAAPTFDATALANALPAAFKASQPVPIVPEKAYGDATDTYSRIASTTLDFKPASAATTVTVGMQPKAIQELFELNYGRMNATLGVELPFTNFNTQTTIPLGYLDPLTETLTDSTGITPYTAADGAQYWKITHNGVDTHVIHFHLFNVQVINRVGWDGAIRPPDPNELGWKESVRMNPLEDCIVAFRAISPTLPFKIGDSIRPLDPTQPIGATLNVTDPTTGNATTVTNVLANFGWEYVWHCHLLGHEENDMMRPVDFQVSPAPPSSLTAAAAVPQSVMLTWTNNATIPAALDYYVQRSSNASFTANVTSFTVPVQTTFTDTTVSGAATYYYRVRAENQNSFSAWSNTATGSATVFTIFEETDPFIAYSGAWASFSSPTYSGGSLKTAGDAGAGFTVDFTGTAVEWIAFTGPTYGKAQVELDGVLQPDADLYSATYLAQQVVFWQTGLAAGPHTLTVSWTGRRNAGAWADNISLDAIGVAGVLTQAVSRTIYQETDTRIAYTGSWTSFSSPAYSGGTLKAGGDAGVGFIVNFTGTAVEWIAFTGPTYGKAQVRLDGVLQPDADLFSATYLAQQIVLSKTGLISGPHTLVVSWTGRRDANPLNWADNISIDAIGVAGVLTQAP